MAEGGTSALEAGAAYADSWIAYRREFRDIPGLVVAVQHHQQLLLSKAYGFARLDESTKTPMTTQHIFRIASHSKTFTATAVMQLVEQGRLRLDDRAAAYLPSLATDVTIRQLLNHVAGIIRDGTAADYWQVDAPFPDRQQLIMIASAGSMFEPNEAFKYSNIGYALLGLIIEAASGTSYNQYVKEHIVDRLGLAHTGPEFDAALSDQLVTGYSRARLGVPRRPVSIAIDTRVLSSATGFYSTAEDLCRYAAAHCLGDDTLLSDASKREAQQPYWTVADADEDYGLGFSIRQIGQRRMVGHGGGFPGQSTRTVIDPVDRLVVVVLSNMSGPDGFADPLAITIVKILDFAVDRARAASAAPGPRLLERFTGRFANLWGVTDVVAFGNALVALSPEADDPLQRVTELAVLDADTLRIAATGGYGARGESFRYIRDSDGNVERVVAGGVSAYPVELFRARYAAPRT
jgi:D-alanyl-D-alanine carboxypeptidase